MRILVVLLLVIEAVWAWRTGRHALMWDHYHELGHAQLRQRQLPRARESFEKAFHAATVLQDGRLGQSQLDLAYLCEAEGYSNQALRHSESALAVFEQCEGPAGPLAGVACANLGRLLLLSNRPLDALEYLGRGLAVLQRDKGLEDELTLRTAVWTLGAYRRAGELWVAWRLAARVWPCLDPRSPEVWQIVAGSEVQMARESLRSFR